MKKTKSKSKIRSGQAESQLRKFKRQRCAVLGLDNFKQLRKYNKKQTKLRIQKRGWGNVRGVKHPKKEGVA
jgi:hypothetical protein